MRFDPQSNSVPTDDGLGSPGGKPPKVRGQRQGGSAAGAIILLFVAAVGAGAWYVDRSGGLEPALDSAGVTLPPEVAALIGVERKAAQAASTAPTALRFVRRDDATSTESAPPASPASVQADPMTGASGDEAPEEPAPDRTAFETGKAFMAIGRHREALPHLREAVRLEPDFADGWYKLGVACAMAGMADDAKDAHETLADLDTSRASMLASLMDRH